MDELHPSYRSNANLADIIFKLSVNFLLYVVLIIVFYMLVRFYLEEETTTTRKDGYHRVPVEEDNEEEPQRDEPNLLREVEMLQQKNQSLISETNGEEDSTPPSISHPSTTSTTSKLRKSSSFNEFFSFETWKDTANTTFSSTTIPARTYDDNTVYEGTKQEVLQRLILCSTGLFVTFCVWGLLQERILTQTYDGAFFEYSYGLVFMNRLGGLILSAALMHYFHIPWSPSILWEYSFPSVANMLSSWCQYEALKYVSFPVVMLAKAFKMVPIMLMGKILNNKTYAGYEYISGALVGFGLYLFINSTDPVQLSTNVFGDPESITGATCGVVLLLLFLCFDSITGQWQSRMFILNPQLAPLQMMLIMNAFSTIFSFITLIHQEELYVALHFVYSHPLFLGHLALFCLASTIGQMFIFYTVKHFGPVVFSIIMSIRILGSTILSCMVYSHPITEMGILGIVIVFGATVYRLSKKAEGKALLRWKEQGNETSALIFKEWHEHVDI